MKPMIILVLLFAAAASAQERRRAVDPPPPEPTDDREIALALGPAASNIVSTVRCTLVDTRLAAGPFGGPRFTAGETRSYVVPSGPCSGIPVALGYALTFTAIGPDAGNVQLKAWDTGAIFPPLLPTVVLSRGTAPNSNDTTARTVAITPNLSGSINVKVDVGTDLLIQLSAYYTAGLVINTTASAPLSGGGTGNISLGIADGAIGDAKLATISTAGKVANSATTATSANTGDAIVTRDSAGGFSAGALTLSGKIDQTSDDGFVASGTPNQGTIPATGVGTRVMWYPKKAAFRAGSSGGQWDDALIGTCSIAMGSSTRASGGFAFAAGSANTASGTYSFAMGDNTTASGIGSVAFGHSTDATGDYSVSMGFVGSATGMYSTNMGNTTFATGDGSTALGWFTTASGTASFAAGQSTTASGTSSTAMGRNATTTDGAIVRNGTFVWGDGSTSTLVHPTADNQFVTRDAGGAIFYSNAAMTTGVTLAANGGSWASVSDRESKTDFEPVDDADILTRLDALPVTSWRYKDDPSCNRYIGPTAQDFHALFGLGTDKTIATMDVDGVTLAAMKALIAEVERLKRRVEELELNSGNAARAHAPEKLPSVRASADR